MPDRRAGLPPNDAPMRLLTRLLHAVDATNERLGQLVSLWIVPLVLLVVFEVIMRYGLAAPTIWGTEAVAFVFAAYILLGGGYTLLRGDHVNMDALYGRLSRRTKAMLDLFNSIVSFLYCAVLLKEGGRLAWEALETWRRSGTDWNPPLFPVLVTLPLGALLLLLQTAAKFVRDLLVAVTGEGRSA